MSRASLNADRPRWEAMFKLYGTGKTLAQVGAAQETPITGSRVGQMFSRYRELDGEGWEARKPSGGGW